jgi:hypothetical protein
MSDPIMTPEEAARAKRQHAKVIAVSKSPNDAYAVVLIDKGTPSDPYLLQVVCERRGDGWHPLSDSNGYGWTALRKENAQGELVGVMTLWGEAPPNAPAVRIRWQGQEVPRQVAEGHYLLADWEVPEDRSNYLPELTSP